MKIFRHKGHTVYNFSKKVCIIKQIDKVRFYFPEAGLIKGLKGLVNLRFKVYPHREFKYFHWLIRTPIFYWDKDNGGHKIGLPNLYLWLIR